MIQIPNYEGIYEVDSSGNVFSVDRVVIGKDGVSYPKKGKKIIPSINKQTGYYYVSLWKNNKGKSHAVHRIVAELFVPNPNSKPEVNHKDSNRLNCKASNLEWVTRSENSIHGYTFGFATQKPRRKLSEDDYKEIFKQFLAGNSMAKIIKNFSISPGRLSVNLKALTIKWGKYPEYSKEIHRQQIQRAHINGKN